MRGGDWECSCGFNNFASRNTCKDCGKGKTGNKGSSNSNNNGKEGDWKCECGFANFAKRNTCRECGKDRGTKSTNYSNNNNNNNSNFKPGDWKCSCGFNNFASRNTCKDCGKNKNSSGGNNNNSFSDNMKEGDWKCECGFANFAKRNTCRECGKDRGTKSTNYSNNNNNNNNSNFRPGDWKCSCGFNNFASRNTCKDCGKNKNSSGGNKSNNNNSIDSNTNSNRVEMKKGDWVCTCGFLNYARRNTCLDCQSKQPKENLMKEGDWICTCGFKNFASRTNCKECDLPKELNSNQIVLKKKSSNLKRLIILDFEATCDEPKNPSPQEIIEFPSVLVDIEQKKIVDKIQFYVKPKSHPKLTKFCTNLTGITQNQVDESPHFPQVFSDYKNWLKNKKLFLDSSNVEDVFVTCGDWDLRKCLPQQLLAIKMENEPCFQKWINIKSEFSVFYNKRAQGMMEMLYSLDLKHYGRHHSGLDDCVNIANIVIKMLQDGWLPSI